MNKQEAFEEVHRLHLDYVLRKVAETGKSKSAPHHARARALGINPPAPGTQREGTLSFLKAGKLRVVATDHSPDGVNPTQAWIGATLVYEADDYGREVRVYRHGEWVDDLVGEAVKQGWLNEVVHLDVPSTMLPEKPTEKSAFRPLAMK
jgi:hypothetical protein